MFFYRFLLYLINVWCIYAMLIFHYKPNGSYTSCLESIAQA